MPGTREFPAGTKLNITAHFDNSASNPFNPDPTKTVKYGPQTYHEMCIGYMFYTRNSEKLNLVADGETGKAVPMEEVQGAD